jgi:hypothetical protein
MDIESGWTRAIGCKLLQLIWPFHESFVRRSNDSFFSNRALMSSSHCLWHIIGRVLAWVTLLFAVGTGGVQPLQA